MLFFFNQDLEKLVHAFITSRVDYCNGLHTGLPKKDYKKVAALTERCCQDFMNFAFMLFL